MPGPKEASKSKKNTKPKTKSNKDPNNPQQAQTAGRNKLGESPQEIKCGNCERKVFTETSYINGDMTWLACALLFFGGLFTGILCLVCWVPFCVNRCKDVEHRCPRCGRVLGQFRRMD